MVLLANKGQSENEKSIRRFVVDESLTKELSSGDVELAAFFDAYDDGSLDILVASGGSIDLYENQLGIDATWIKAMAYTGFCGKLDGEREI